MLCPKCGSTTRKTTIKYNIKENETYRYRMCNFKGCGHKFYTVEFTIEEDENFKDNWEMASRTMEGK